MKTEPDLQKPLTNLELGPLHSGRSTRLLWGLLLLLVMCGVYSRVNDFHVRELEYDEAWMCRGYIVCSLGDIFTDLRTPNNHPLYSAVCHFLMAEDDSISVTWLRIPAVLSGILLLLLSVYAARRIPFRGNWYAAFLCAAFVGFSAPLIHFSATARGYAMQCVFVFVFWYLCGVCVGGGASRMKGWAACGLLFCGIGMCLTITSGLVFPAAAGAAFLSVRFAKRNPWKQEMRALIPFFTAGLLFFVFAGLWYGMHLSQLRSAQQFGANLGGVVGFVGFACTPLWKIGAIPLLIAAAIPLFRRDSALRSWSLYTLLFTGLCLFSAVFTKAGPPRVYLPILAPLAVVAACSLAELFFRKIPDFRMRVSLVAVICLGAGAFGYQQFGQWRPLGWNNVLRQIESDLLVSIYPVFPPGDTFAMFLNHPPFLRGHAERSSAELKALLVFDGDSLSGVQSVGEGLSKAIPLPPVSSRKTLLSHGHVGTLYLLRPLRADDDPNAHAFLLAQIPFQPDSDFQAQLAMFASPEWIFVNPFLSRGAILDETVFRSAILAAQKTKFSAVELLEKTRRSGGMLRFYVPGD